MKTPAEASRLTTLNKSDSISVIAVSEEKPRRKPDRNVGSKWLSSKNEVHSLVTRRSSSFNTADELDIGRYEEELPSSRSCFSKSALETHFIDVPENGRSPAIGWISIQRRSVTSFKFVLEVGQPPTTCLAGAWWTQRRRWWLHEGRTTGRARMRRFENVRGGKSEADDRAPSTFDSKKWERTPACAASQERLPRPSRWSTVERIWRGFTVAANSSDLKAAHLWCRSGWNMSFCRCARY